MHWLQPPSLVRRIAAVALVLGAIGWDLRHAATIPHPVAHAPIAAGTVIGPEHLAWIDLPVGLLPESSPVGGVAAVPIGAGEPFTDALLTEPTPAPDGWWTVPLDVGTIAAPGDEVMLVVADPPLAVVGIVIEAQIGDPFDLAHRPAAVAVPPEAASLVAAAAQHDRLVTAIRTPAGGR